MRTVIAACGCGHDGRLGTGTCDSQSRATLLPFFAERTVDEDGNPIGDIRAVRVGGYHNFAITTTGVYGWGLNEHGQLGLGKGSAASLATPRRIPFFDAHTVVEIACGSYHTLAWTVDGLFACGRNEDGQLGLVRNDDHYAFTRVLSPAQVNGADDDTSQCTIDETATHCVVRCGRLTHVSCGTHHSLLSFCDATVEDHRSGDHNGDPGAPVPARRLAWVIVAAGKGDFGELGYDADAWSALQAKAKAADIALRHRIRHTEAHTVEVDASAGADTSSSSPMQWRPLRERRAAFSSSCFRPVALPPASMMDAEVSVAGLRASHLHSAAVLRDRAGGAAGLHWGCYYCGAVEDAAASASRGAGDGALSVHGGAEWLLRATGNGAEVMGSGPIGLGAEDSFATDWTPLRVSGAVRAISGREHCILLTEDTVFGFGDNLHGQLGAAGEGDTVLEPAVVLRTGDCVGSAVVAGIRDAVGGSRHTVFLIDIA